MKIPEYRKAYGSNHASASGGTQPVDEHILKLFLRQQFQRQFPMTTRPRAGQIIQRICDNHFGIADYQPELGVTEEMPLEEAINDGIREFKAFAPITYDDGRDVETKERLFDDIPVMAQHAAKGIQEYFEGQVPEGEYERTFIEDKLDVPVIGYIDYARDNKMLDLKCSFPIRNPIKKDGTRTWRVTEPRTEPTPTQIMQQAVYYQATGQKPALLFVTSKGYHLATEENCDDLTVDALEESYDMILRRWIVIQNHMRDAKGSWKELFARVNPDFQQIAQRHGPEILTIAKEAWRIK